MVVVSRTIFRVVLAGVLAVAVGCGSKPEQTLPSTKLEEQPPAPPGSQPADPNAGSPKVEPPKVVAWVLDQTKHAIPAAPVKGKIAGADVTPTVQIQGAELTFQANGRAVKINLAPMLIAGQAPPPVIGREWKVKNDAEPGPAVPHVWLEEPGKNPYFAPSGYALSLELGQRKDGKVPGKVYLCLLDEQKSVLAGTFEAAYARSFTEGPGPDDAPYVGGEVTVIGAKAGAEVRVAYVGFSPAGIIFKELQLGCTTGIEWLPDPDKSTLPRASQLVSGDGKDRPFRYEHVKLPPGRYLISAAVVGGPAVWKWVDVTAASTLTENFAIDTTKSGGVEVTVPAGVTGKVFIGPADAPDKPPLAYDLFTAVAFQVVRQDTDLVGGKALIKNLGPGKYEVRAGDLRGFVDVVAGKTVEFSLTPPKK